MKLTKDILDLKEMVREFMNKEIVPHVAKYDISGETPYDLIDKCLEMELNKSYMPEKFGGPGLSALASTVIAEELARLGLEVDRRRVLLDAPIRVLGEFEVRVRLHADVNAVFKLKVVPEERIHDDYPSAAPQESVPEQAESAAP